MLRKSFVADRRTVMATAIGMGLAGSSGAAAVPLPIGTDALAMPVLYPIFTAHVNLGPPVEFGQEGEKRKRLIPITGGTFEGPKLRGTIIPGGGDWQAIGPDGTTEIFARYTLRADDGTMIGVVNPGIRRGPPEVLKRLAAGELVDPSLYYFRTVPTFDVADGRHDWLRKSIFLCAGVRRASDVEIHFYGLT